MSGTTVLSHLKRVVDLAQKKIDTETAKNPSLKQAISIVEQFLRQSGRVCYGGQAINSFLPKQDQFYDPERNLPDYDFFSPNEKADTKELIHMLKEAGYSEISRRVGIHEGTTKLYVNFFPIADVTEIDPEFYLHIRRKANIINGIHYTDPIFLRMMMYLELSRPKGMITRWEKVYQRLDLLDKAQPLTVCKYSRPIFLKDDAMTTSHPILMQYILTNHRVYMGANMFGLYNKSKKSIFFKVKKVLNEISPVMFLSNDAEMDARILKDSIPGTEKREILGYQNILPAMIGLYSKDVLLALIIQEEACHSYFSIPITSKSKTMLRVASLDTLLTFLIGLYYREDDTILQINSLLCWIQIFNDLSKFYRAHPTQYIEAFATDCSGYQTTFASLLRAKGARIEAARQKISSQSVSKGIDSRIRSKTRSKTLSARSTRSTRRRST
jgi:hypothetical protein